MNSILGIAKAMIMGYKPIKKANAVWLLTAVCSGMAFFTKKYPNAPAIMGGTQQEPLYLMGMKGNIYDELSDLFCAKTKTGISAKTPLIAQLAEWLNSPESRAIKNYKGDRTTGRTSRQLGLQAQQRRTPTLAYMQHIGLAALYREGIIAASTWTIGASQCINPDGFIKQLNDALQSLRDKCNAEYDAQRPYVSDWPLFAAITIGAFLATGEYKSVRIYQDVPYTKPLAALRDAGLSAVLGAAIGGNHDGTLAARDPEEPRELFGLLPQHLTMLDILHGTQQLSNQDIKELLANMRLALNNLYPNNEE